MTKIKITKLNPPLADRYWYVQTPADYVVTHDDGSSAITHEDAMHDGEIQCFDDIGEVAGALWDEEIEEVGAETERQAEEWIEGAVSGGSVEIDEATHEDLVAHLYL